MFCNENNVKKIIIKMKWKWKIFFFLHIIFQCYSSVISILYYKYIQWHILFILSSRIFIKCSCSEDIINQWHINILICVTFQLHRHLLNEPYAYIYYAKYQRICLDFFFFFLKTQERIINIIYFYTMWALNTSNLFFNSRNTGEILNLSFCLSFQKW